MKLENIVVLLCVVSCSAAQPQILECIRDLNDFEMYNWKGLYTLRYAEDSSELPGVMNGAIDGKGIFYADGSQGSYQRFYKPFPDVVNIRPAYIYVKYYAHVVNVTQQEIYAFPILGDQFHDLPNAPDFTWREALLELNVDLVVGSGPYHFDANAAAGGDLVRGDFLLVDTIIFAQGANISNINEIKALCPPEIEPTTTTTTEKPSDTILECIDDQQDFVFNGWSSYPPHKYAHNSSSIPANFGNLTGEGIFYFNDAPPFHQHVFFKDYLSQFEGGNGPAYIYLKYYVRLARTDSKAAYIQPVEAVPGEYSFELGSSVDVTWQEKLLEIDTKNSIVGSLVEIGILNNQPGEFLLVDEIIVSRGHTLAETLQQLSSCL